MHAEHHARPFRDSNGNTSEEFTPPTILPL
jgi:hypothetical protein